MAGRERRADILVPLWRHRECGLSKAAVDRIDKVGGSFTTRRTMAIPCCLSGRGHSIVRPVGRRGDENTGSLGVTAVVLGGFCTRQRRRR